MLGAEHYFPKLIYSLKGIPPGHEKGLGAILFPAVHYCAQLLWRLASSAPPPSLSTAETARYRV